MVKMGYVWDRTIEFLGDNIAVLLPIVLLAIFVPTSISNSLQGLQPTAAAGVKLGLGILSLGFAILSLWAQLAIAALAIDPAIGARASRIATARLLPAIGVYLLLLIGLLVLSLPLVALAIAGGVDVTMMRAAGAMPSFPAGVGFAIAGYGLAYLIALLFIGARLTPLTSVVVAERRGVGAIRRAFALSRGLTWKLVGVIILYVVVMLVATLAAQTVFGSVLRLVAGGDGPVTVASVLTAVVVAAVSTAFTVLAAVFCAKLYVAIIRARDATAPIGDPLPHDPAAAA